MKFPKSKSVVIKKRRAERGLLLFLMLVLTALFLFVLFMPFHRLVNLDQRFDNLCYAIGGVGTVTSLVISAVQFYVLVAKSTAIVITEEGIYDFVTGGKGVGFIEKGKQFDLDLKLPDSNRACAYTISGNLISGQSSL